MLRTPFSRWLILSSGLWSCQGATGSDSGDAGPGSGGANTTDGPSDSTGEDSTGDRGAAGGADGAGGTRPTVDCVNRSFACWPMPHPIGSGLPHPQSYRDQGDGTVKDEVTGLVWQKATLGKFSYADAQSACASSTLAGAPWRVPKRVELLSLHDFTRDSPALDEQAFDGTSGFFWTSSPWVVSQIDTKPQLSWIVNFAEGLTSNAGDRAGVYNVRCVQGVDDGQTAIPEGLYEVNDTDEVTDTRTGLVWQAGDSGVLGGLEDGEAYCAALTLNGHAWRLPSIKELVTLVDENPPISDVSPAIDTAHFPGTAERDPYWSSSPFTAWQLDAGEPQWVINFLDGFTQYGKDQARSRCVR